MLPGYFLYYSSLLVSLACCVYCRDHVVNNDQLTIFNVKEEDAGEYVCMATNTYGSVRGFFVLRVGGRITTLLFDCDSFYLISISDKIFKFGCVEAILF